MLTTILIDCAWLIAWLTERFCSVVMELNWWWMCLSQNQLRKHTIVIFIHFLPTPFMTSFIPKDGSSPWALFAAVLAVKIQSAKLLMKAG